MKVSFVKDSKWRRYQDNDSENTSVPDDKSDDVSAHLHEYARREGPHEDSDSLNDQYNISGEEDIEGFENSDVFTGDVNDDDSSAETQPKYVHHPYAHDYAEFESNSDPEEKESNEEPVEKPIKRQKYKQIKTPSRKSAKKIVYVYKQPPIIVKPKPTNVYIRSKPIVVQPPPLVVHHPQPKPCNPIIKYQPPNIKLKPVIVKISKPKTTTTTTTTTPCPTTTKKPCRKCRRKPSKKCGRCSKRKQSTTKSSRPKDVTVYYNQHHYHPSDPAQYVQYKNVKCDGCLT